MVAAAVVNALVAGENPIAVWRNYRQLTPGALAQRAGISPAYLSQLESGAHQGSTETLARIAHAHAHALDLALDDLV